MVLLAAAAAALPGMADGGSDRIASRQYIICMAAWLSQFVLSLSAQQQTPRDCRLLLIRHGRTFMNEHLATPGKEWGADGFSDPGYWDTELTPLGEQQAQQLNAQFCASSPRVDMLICSPLRRALRTAELAFDGSPGASISQRLVTPLAAERLFLSSDVGSPVAELSSRFSPEWRLDEALDDGWWYQNADSDTEWRPPGTYLTVGEPQHEFSARMGRLTALLHSCCAAESEIKCIALVSHAEVIQALTGRAVKNCECLELRISDLPAAPSQTSIYETA